MFDQISKYHDLAMLTYKVNIAYDKEVEECSIPVTGTQGVVTVNIFVFFVASPVCSVQTTGHIFVR